MKHAPSDDPVPLGLHLRMDGSRQVGDKLPLFCGTMFTLGVIDGVLRVPVFQLMLLVTPIMLERKWEMGPTPIWWYLALVTMASSAVLEIIGNATLFGRWRHALKLGYCALAASILSFVYWFLPLARMAHEWINEDPPLGLALAAWLLFRFAFLIAYGFALRRY